jgi:hypothetical protein
MVNKIFKPSTLTSTTRNYYPRPTYADLQFEEMPQIQNMIYYNGKEIVEWNLDGFTEYQIFTLCHQMIMYANACIANGNKEREAANMIVIGFSGQLKGWWNNYLNETQRQEILCAVKRDDQGRPLPDRDGNGNPTGNISDALATLIYNIIYHFAGNYHDIYEKNREQLINLKCKTMSDFRWYKDTFLSKLYTLPEPNQDFWKEKYISGLPPLFAEKVRNSLRKEGGGSINYHYLDIGKITQKIQLVGAELCNDLKIKDQLKKQRILGKREMGDFCYQFGFQDPYVHRKRKTHSKPMTKPNDKSKMSFQATKRKPKRIYNKNIRTQDTESKETICYKCGLKGHIANRCFKSKVKKEIQALLDSESEDVKEKLEAILNNIDNDSSSDEEKNAEINCCQDSGCSCCEPDNSEEESDENILVLTSLEEFVLDTFETIQDPEEKRRVLEKFLSRVKTDKDKLKKDIQKSKFLSIDEVFKRLDEQKKKNEQPDLISLFEDQKIMKQDLEEIRKRLYMLESKEGFHMEEKDEPIQEDDHVVGTIQKYMKQKWYTEVMYRFIDGSYFQHITLIDSGADVNCIREGIIPHKYFYKAAHRIRGADGGLLTVEYQIPEIYICITEVCIKTSFLLVKNLKQDVILGTPFLSLIRPFLVTNEDIQFKIMGKQVSLRFSSNTDEILDQLVQTKREQVVNTIYLHDNSFPSYLPKSMDLPGKTSWEDRYLLKATKDLEYICREMASQKSEWLTNMSSWRLPQLPRGHGERFNHNFRITELQQGLLNLLWQTKNKKEKAHALNGLAYYFKNFVPTDQKIT